MLEAALLRYRKIRRDLEEIGFEFNPYNSCVVTRDTHDKQQTIRFHVYDVLLSHKNSEVNNKFAKWAKEKYGKLKTAEVKQGKVHTFLGMTLGFLTEGKCHVQQEEYIDDIVGAWLESVKISTRQITPCSANLFEKGEGELLSDDLRETLHCVVAKALFMSNRSTLDIIPTVSVLLGRVRSSNQSDWVKCRRLVRYLSSTQNKHLILR